MSMDNNSLDNTKQISNILLLCFDLLYIHLFIQNCVYIYFLGKIRTIVLYRYTWNRTWEDFIPAFVCSIKILRYYDIKLQSIYIFQL